MGAPRAARAGVKGGQSSLEIMDVINNPSRLGVREGIELGVEKL